LHHLRKLLRLLVTLCMVQTQQLRDSRCSSSSMVTLQQSHSSNSSSMVMVQ
jgi:hypothetical protein